MPRRPPQRKYVSYFGPFGGGVWTKLNPFTGKMGGERDPFYWRRITGIRRRK